MGNDSNNEKPTVNQAATLDGTADGTPALTTAAQEEIGRRLRGVYGQMASEPLPEKFQKLLEQLSKSRALGPDAEK